MTAQDLKNSILKLAMRGKLVQQDTNEEPVDLKGFKLKNTDECEFDIPDSWRWAHLESISTGISSKRYQILESEVKSSGKYSVISQSKAYSIGFTDNIEKVYSHEQPVVVFGDHTTEVKYLDFDFVVGADGVKIFEPIYRVITAKFLFYALQYYSIGLSKVGGYSRHYKFIKNKPIPLPPIAEQERIVAKIDKLLPLIEEYGKAETRLKELNDDFPDMLRKSILQQAIQGKLTQRNPEDEPASELLKHIQTEKAQLVKDGKLKKEKPLPPITEEEIPFDIPDTWEWVRLGDLGKTQTGTTPSTKNSTFFGMDIPFIKPADIYADHIDYENEGLSFLGCEQGRKISRNSVMMVCIGGSIGKTYFNDRDVCCNQQINTITPLFCDIKYVWLAMSSNYFYEKLQEKATGTATPIINKNLWSNIVIPLPPLEEQKRIIARVEELLALCDMLK